MHYGTYTFMCIVAQDRRREEAYTYTLKETTLA